MADTRFTALGLSQSGKTCYILGMYYEMCVGVRGFTLTTQNENASRLEAWMDKLDDETGKDRFPLATNPEDSLKYTFNLFCHNKYIISFDWLDYGGEVIKLKDSSPKYAELTESILNSTVLYVFINGESLCDEDIKKKEMFLSKQGL